MSIQLQIALFFLPILFSVAAWRIEAQMEKHNEKLDLLLKIFSDLAVKEAGKCK